jgi:hypothetical protein
VPNDPVGHVEIPLHYPFIPPTFFYSNIPFLRGGGNSLPLSADIPSPMQVSAMEELRLAVMSCLEQVEQPATQALAAECENTHSASSEVLPGEQSLEGELPCGVATITFQG